LSEVLAAITLAAGKPKYNNKNEIIGGEIYRIKEK